MDEQTQVPGLSEKLLAGRKMILFVPDVRLPQSYAGSDRPIRSRRSKGGRAGLGGDQGRNGWYQTVGQDIHDLEAHPSCPCRCSASAGSAHRSSRPSLSLGAACDDDRISGDRTLDLRGATGRDDCSDLGVSRATLNHLRAAHHAVAFTRWSDTVEINARRR